MSGTRLTVLVLALCSALTVSACGKKKPAPAPPPPPPVEAPETPPPPPPPPPPPAPAERPLTEEEAFAKKTLEQLNAEKPLEDVFFAFDRSDLDDESRAALQKNSGWLNKWKSTKILIEGHCDNRGTPEYNLALGDRRAAAVQAYLASLGIPADRITTVSKGEESPFCDEETEGCWSQNRRGHFLITAK
jgi:peptidoglycan-associated lipoprotein